MADRLKGRFTHKDRLKGLFTHKEMSMPKSLPSDKTARRPKEPFDPALEDPIALMPDQLETVVGGFEICRGPVKSDPRGSIDATMGLMPMKPPADTGGILIPPGLPTF